MMNFNAEKDLAICGLACVLCSAEDCPGCKARGCKEGSDCSVYQCATKKEVVGWRNANDKCGYDVLAAKTELWDVEVWQ